ncbi:MAG: hypothetical protein NT087_03220 [Deltaproteobacteria bacterium]|nr:hypothetical protein [Deltaproteobacteria bacterium]
MPAQRPVILEALKTLLKAGVAAVSNRVYLPWEALPEHDAGAMLQIAIDDSTTDAGVVIGLWEHTVPVKIGAIKAGKFDYQAVWDILNAAAAAIQANYTLAGSVESIEITGQADHLIQGGDRILWPHLAATITYRTQRGAL